MMRRICGEWVVCECVSRREYGGRCVVMGGLRSGPWWWNCVGVGLGGLG